jgi:hydrogenase expression/formation protein HypE
MEERILLAHGSGGRKMRELIEGVFLPQLGSGYPGIGSEDSAVIDLPHPGSRLAITTDSYVVTPLFFPGSNIGELAINGTVNDLAMSGAVPLYITAGFIIEEGLALSELGRIVKSMKEAAARSGVTVVAGDTKVVDRGKADGLYINTSGVGLVPDGVNVSSSGLRPGDVLIVSGTLGDHGMAVMSVREGLGFESEIKSDSAPLGGLVKDILDVCPDVHALRDPTRGGLAATLNEFAESSGVGITVDERAIPVTDAVRGACELLGLDPLYVANEGKLVASVPAGRAEAVLGAMRANEYGRNAAIIGEVTGEPVGKVLIRTLICGRRFLDMPAGEILPRIC